MTRRAKLFGMGIAIPLCREAKTKLMHRARSLVRTRGISAKAFVVFEVLLWSFHNGKDGRCFPSYERIAEQAGCSRSTVALAIKALELCHLLTWHIRIARVRINGLVKLIRLSNAYRFPVLASPKSDLRTGTPIQNLSFPGSKDLLPGLSSALERLGSLVRRQ